MNMMVFNIEELKNIITKVANDYNIQKILLFGSYFDGNPSEKSDIDLLVYCIIDIWLNTSGLSSRSMVY